MLGGFVEGGSLALSSPAIARYTTTSGGKLDPLYPGGGFQKIADVMTGTIASLLEQGDGKVLVLGEKHDTAGGFFLVRYEANGSLDVGFGPDALNPIDPLHPFSPVLLLGECGSLAVQSDGKIIAAGGSRVLRLLSTGALDSSFGTSGSVTVPMTIRSPTASVAVDRFGRILIAGSIITTGTDSLPLVRSVVTRLMADGSVDTSFGTMGTAEMAVDLDHHSALQIMSSPAGLITVIGSEAVGSGELSNAAFYMAKLSAGGVAGAPALVVTSSIGALLPHQGSPVDFGEVAVGSKTTLTFTLRNEGVSPLTGLSLSLAGSGAPDWSVAALSSTTLAAGAAAAIQVTFQPRNTGTTSATLRIASNDPGVPSYALDLKGTGATGVAFGELQSFAFEENGSAIIPIIRTGSTDGPVSVTITSAIGSASASDFGAITGSVIEMGAGESSTTLAVPITADAIAEGNEFFTLTMSNPQGAKLSSPSTTTVRIVEANDTTKPTAFITTPKAGQVFSEGAIVSLTGTAADNRGIRKVQFSLNGSAFSDATITVSSSGLTASYVATLQPLPGPNSVVVKCIDTRNNESLVVTRTFYYHVLRPLTMVIDGTGTVPLPIAAATYKVNFPYTITAKPGVGQVFDGWTVNDTTGTNITAAMMELPMLTFTHREGLTLTAHFKPNPFTPSIIGTFTGLVLPSTLTPAPNGSNASNETVGWISANVLSTGAFTGTVKIDGLTLPMNGIFDNAGDARFGTTRSKTLSLARTTKPALEVALKLDMTGTISKLTGTVTQRYRTTVTAVSDIDADRAAYLLAKNAPPSLAGTSSKPYTMVFKHRTSQPGLLAVDYPQGDGYATGTIKTDGTVSISGKLADHTAITASAPLSKVNRWPLFAQLYVLKGSFSTWINMDESATDTDMTSSSVHWFRPYQATQWYPWGWGEGIEVDIIGAHYAPSPASVFSVPLPVDALNGNATLTFSDGQLAAPVVKAVNINITNVATKAPATDASFTFTLTPSTGLISGTYFTHTDLTKPAWQGVLFQKGTNKAGYGYFMTVSPRVVDGTGESGAVKLLAR